MSRRCGRKLNQHTYEIDNDLMGKGNFDTEDVFYDRASKHFILSDGATVLNPYLLFGEYSEMIMDGEICNAIVIRNDEIMTDYKIHF